jgi:hypothetical protein
MFGQAIKSKRIVQFILQQTGTYEDQFMRPYQTNMNHDTYEKIIEHVETSSHITAAGIASVSNNFIKPSATPEYQVNITNGWGLKRLRYFLNIELKDQYGTTTNEYVVGYTDHYGLSTSLHLDPDMVFYINAINQTRSMTHVTPMGAQTQHSVIDSSHVISDNNYQGINSNIRKFGLRPEDVFTSMDKLDIQAGFDIHDTFMHTPGIITPMGIKSKRDNAVAPIYIANMLDSYVQSRKDDGVIDDVNRFRKNASSVVASEDIRNDFFMSFIKARSINNRSTSFTYADLMALDPNVVNVTVPHIVNDSGLHQRGQTSGWGGSDYTTLFATILAQSIPSYMLQYGINKIHIASTNSDFSGKMTTLAENVRTFNTVSMVSATQSFIFKLETELMKGVTYNGQMTYSVNMVCDLLGEIWIQLSLNGEPPIDFVYPSFCDSLLAPIQTYNEKIADGIALDFQNLMSNVSSMSNGFVSNEHLPNTYNNQSVSNNRAAALF